MLEEAKRRGFLGPGPVEAHLDHAAGFAQVVRAVAGGAGDEWRAADLGSGGGVPALPLALDFPRSIWVLVESGLRRAAFLREAVATLALGARVEVVEDRAEVVGRSPARRGQFDVVVARGFGPPTVVAECAAPLLRVDGMLVVSEPPGGEPARWPATGLRALGMRPDASVRADGWSFQVVRQSVLCSDRFPRRVGMPAKRPLF